MLCNVLDVHALDPCNLFEKKRWSDYTVLSRGVGTNRSQSHPSRNHNSGLLWLDKTSRYLVCHSMALLSTHFAFSKTHSKLWVDTSIFTHGRATSTLLTNEQNLALLTALEGAERGHLVIPSATNRCLYKGGPVRCRPITSGLA